MNKELFEEYKKHHTPLIGIYNPDDDYTIEEKEKAYIFCLGTRCRDCIFSTYDVDPCGGTGPEGVSVNKEERKEFLKTNPEWFV